ncbi:GIY-YIG catalytic domain containing protein [Talaromyces stipitatus ATCC 10500]|uniref:Structure-specific endonuclease subunit slx1 n=1 Tax=Talaromyces stipitatus (strain ATCC 10500 / CBS 375.48 / QM 6759 / NRRL 1006) TaxID=441959 RepID=SLX1_TALSN|nr:GIY-YIG catalytic domain containing protein [Talaromyces stipitatus ATCC 10500]B8MDD1.1 RecName: Full=Structure-specific endonuclease subunit slx1 [Talaromyces stipitatus ATCC 10500]EED17894.1 GIY-YIG catalytic domain containing protein [Talaromyces stipitatus ATCC 10500]
MTTTVSEEAVLTKPIPAFYCCYLLRSAKRPSALYIGSTPDPARRLEQHNGFAKGGAKRTERNTLRPWEMVAIVEGFPSRTGALQFEWSWQHVHTTRHIGAVETDQLNRKRKNPPTDKGSGIWTSTPKVLGNLHQLLRSTYFGTWPLTVRFLSSEAHNHWQRWIERADGLLPDTIRVKLDFRAEGASVLDSNLPANDMTHIDATYGGIQEHLAKSTSLLGDNTNSLSCEVCQQQLSTQTEIIVVCSHRRCHAVFHVNCISQLFLEDEGSSGLVPILGECPACRQEVTWVELMKELSMRLHGGKNATKLLKGERKDKANTQGTKSSKGGKKPAKTGDYTLDGDYEDLDEDWMNAVNVEPSSEDGDRNAANVKGSTGRVEIVIDDSEEDGFD